MRLRRVAPGEPSACLPLCCDPNAFRSNDRGLLTRWSHGDLRVRNVAMKFLSRAIGLSTRAIYVGEFKRLQVPHCVLGADYDAFVCGGRCDLKRDYRRTVHHKGSFGLPVFCIAFNQFLRLTMRQQKNVLHSRYWRRPEE